MGNNGKNIFVAIFTSGLEQKINADYMVAGSNYISLHSKDNNNNNIIVAAFPVDKVNAVINSDFMPKKEDK